MNSDRKPGHLRIDNKSKYLYHGCLLVFYSVGKKRKIITSNYAEMGNVVQNTTKTKGWF
jgi:hypothetical protein